MLTVSIWYGLDRVPQQLAETGTVVTIGVFDGVHRGHQTLVNRAVKLARERGIPSVMFTFDPHPTVVFQPERVPALLGTVEQRIELATELGIDHVVVVSFTPEIAAWSPAEYVEEALVRMLGAQAVVVGDNFTFGHRAEGTAAMLQELGEQRGVEVHVLSLLEDSAADDAADGESALPHVVCSTWIRGRLAAGDVAGAATGLGRYFSVTGVIEHGAGRGGRALGFPTTNQYFPEKYALPADGVYAGYVTLVVEDAVEERVGTMPLGERMPAAISVGTNPTFGHEPRSVESFILDHDADIYGRVAKVEFVERIRGQETYTSLDELIEAIDRDVEQVRSVLLD